LDGWSAGFEIKTHATLVNRDQKGDRLQVKPAFRQQASDKSRNTVPPPAALRELPEGCESAVSPIADVGLARIASVCVS
jgi:hypothetical protein